MDLSMGNYGAYVWSSVVFGMPREAIALGAAVETLPLDQIAPRLVAQLG